MDIKRVQSRLLEIGKTVCEVLQSHDIPHMISYGTLLGAVRHGGFIPWDDDFDLFLFNDSYDSAIDALRKDLPTDLFVEYFDSEPLYFHGWAHVKDCRTIASCSQYPQDGIYQHKGISVDLYNAVYMQESELDSFIIEEQVAYFRRRNRAGALSDEELSHRIGALPEKADEGKFGRQIFGIAMPEKYMLYDDVLPLKKYKFEGIDFWGPNNYDAILKHFYGDYMSLPPKEHQIPHYDNVIFIDD